MEVDGAETRRCLVPPRFLGVLPIESAFRRTSWDDSIYRPSLAEDKRRWLSQQTRLLAGIGRPGGHPISVFGDQSDDRSSHWSLVTRQTRNSLLWRERRGVIHHHTQENHKFFTRVSSALSHTSHKLLVGPRLSSRAVH